MLKRVVIVTGASRGLGREIALQFGTTGCRVVVNYRSKKGTPGPLLKIFKGEEERQSLFALM